MKHEAARTSDQIVAWAFGDGRGQIDSVLGQDPVVRYWLSLRRRPQERLAVLFEESGGNEVCARCAIPCCDVPWVMQLGHVLAWPLIGVPAAPAVGKSAAHCAYLGSSGCTLSPA